MCLFLFRRPRALDRRESPSHRRSPTSSALQPTIIRNDKPSHIKKINLSYTFPTQAVSVGNTLAPKCGCHWTEWANELR